MGDDPIDDLKKALAPSGVELRATVPPSSMELATRELSSRASGLADDLKTFDDRSLSQALEALKPSLETSDTLAEARASIDAMQLDRGVVAGTFGYQLVEVQATTLADIASPMIELQQQLTSLASERASFLETIRHQIVESAAHATLRSAVFAPAIEIQQQLRESLEIHNAWSDTLRQQAFASQAAFRAMSDNMTSMQKQIRDSTRPVDAATFRLPKLDESPALTAKMFEAFRLPQNHIEDTFRTLAETMSQMSSPWLNIQREFQSTKAFTALQDLGQVINAGKVFDDRSTELVRVALGDWRNRITLPESVAELRIRTALYLDRGFDSELTQFPPVAFDQAITIARIKRPPPRFVITFQSPLDGAAPDEEEGHDLRNFAHDYLQRFETRIRQFIATRMAAACGVDWEKQRVPADLLADWVKKRDRHRDYGGADFPLIAFADFTHYEPIIVRKDNWAAVFGDIFRRKESVTESLQRLYPIRLAAMHARPVTQDDLLLLYVEIKRLCMAMN